MSILQLLELQALLASFLALASKNRFQLKLLSPVMIITALAEATSYLIRVRFRESNHFIYNISVPIIVFLLMCVFHKQFKTVAFKKASMTAIVLYSCFVGINILFIQGTHKFATYNYIIGGLFLSFICTLYFFELMKVARHISLISEPLFWLGSGILLMYLPKSVLYALFEHLSYNVEVRTSFSETFFFLNTVLSAIFYLSISIACISKWIFPASPRQLT